PLADLAQLGSSCALAVPIGPGPTVPASVQTPAANTITQIIERMDGPSLPPRRAHKNAPSVWESTQRGRPDRLPHAHLEQGDILILKRTSYSVKRRSGVADTLTACPLRCSLSTKRVSKIYAKGRRWELHASASMSWWR